MCTAVDLLRAGGNAILHIDFILIFQVGESQSGCVSTTRDHSASGTGVGFRRALGEEKKNLSRSFLDRASAMTF